MNYQVVVTSKAKLQFAACARWWSERRSAEQASRWLDGFEEAIASLRESPERHSLAREGVSLNNFINSTIAASVAQEETLRFFDERLRDVDLEKLHDRVLRFMSKIKSGDGPTLDELRQAMGSD